MASRSAAVGASTSASDRLSNSGRTTMSMARRSLQVVAFLCTLVVGAASMAVIVTQTTWFKEWLRGFIVRQAEDYVNGRLSIGRLDGNLFFGVDLEDVD